MDNGNINGAKYTNSKDLEIHKNINIKAGQITKNHLSEFCLQLLSTCLEKNSLRILGKNKVHGNKAPIIAKK
ncbi:hypothetical protein ACH24_03375 [Francisella persica ATCC VR-331]|uniref:Uncharacterized protein n=1 Tax=Francisella persica ATCC VR-331 TaxID=1086726 RepID=A0AAC8ZMS8_9GAMM|nr:hypothetical protein [Francisella persica]ALB01744.1 hypothetical protein ACH24_03375 [Francisella persica ATCC VR-331]ANH78048.1 hypothetical protein FSC845_06215 [Francisella persica ATCC VR-331]